MAPVPREHTADLPATAADLTAGAHPSRARWGLIAVLFAVTAINYLDRTNMAVALPHISEDFDLTATQKGLILSAFGWTYALLQVPGGWLVDRLGAKLSYGIAIVGWSVATAAMALARSFALFVGFRMALGVFEAPAFPANTRLIAAWFPPQERARATSLYTAGEYIGLAVAVPLLSWLAIVAGWHSLFIVTGAIGLAMSVVWFRRVHESPATSPKVNTAELAYIQSSDADRNRAVIGRRTASWREIRALLSRRRLWGLYLGQFANGTVLYFFLTWFPSYLVSEKHFSAIKVGVVGSLPYLAALIGVLVGGFASDYLMRHGWSLTWARKVPIMTSFVLVMPMVLANYVDSVVPLLFVMSLALFAQGLGTQGWTLVADMAPVKLLGVTGGVFNLFANFGGVLAPIIVGIIVDRTGSFALAIAYISATAVMGFLAYLLLVDRVERVEL